MTGKLYGTLGPSCADPDTLRALLRRQGIPVELKPGVRDTLARLRAEGARMCVCSNTRSSRNGAATLIIDSN